MHGDLLCVLAVCKILLQFYVSYVLIITLRFQIPGGKNLVK